MLFQPAVTNDKSEVFSYYMKMFIFSIQSISEFNPDIFKWKLKTILIMRIEWVIHYIVHHSKANILCLYF